MESITIKGVDKVKPWAVWLGNWRIEGRGFRILLFGRSGTVGLSEVWEMMILYHLHWYIARIFWRIDPGFITWLSRRRWLHFFDGILYTEVGE